MNLEEAELSSLKTAMAAHQEQQGALQTALLQQTGNTRDASELKALRSKLIVEQTEVRMLQQSGIVQPLPDIAMTSRIAELHRDLDEMSTRVKAMNNEEAELS